MVSKVSFSLSRNPLNTYSFSCKILRDATPKSFVILDGEPSQRIASYCIHLPIVELGRGTSTYVSRSFS